MVTCCLVKATYWPLNMMQAQLKFPGYSSPTNIIYTGSISVITMQIRVPRRSFRRKPWSNTAHHLVSSGAILGCDGDQWLLFSGTDCSETQTICASPATERSLSVTLFLLVQPQTSMGSSLFSGQSAVDAWVAGYRAARYLGLKR